MEARRGPPARGRGAPIREADFSARVGRRRRPTRAGRSASCRNVGLDGPAGSQFCSGGATPMRKRRSMTYTNCDETVQELLRGAHVARPSHIAPPARRGNTSRKQGRNLLRGPDLRGAPIVDAPPQIRRPLLPGTRPPHAAHEPPPSTSRSADSEAFSRSRSAARPYPVGGAPLPGRQVATWSPGSPRAARAAPAMPRREGVRDHGLLYRKA